MLNNETIRNINIKKIFNNIHMDNIFNYIININIKNIFDKFNIIIIIKNIVDYIDKHDLTLSNMRLF